MDKDKRKELMEAYKQIKVYMGVYQIKNNDNSKVLIGTSSNLKNRWLTLRMQLEANRHPNARLQKDWNDFGPDSFSYEVIEQKECKDIININWELEKMEKEWLEKLEPYDDKGYNKKLMKQDRRIKHSKITSVNCLRLRFTGQIWQREKQ